MAGPYLKSGETIVLTTDRVLIGEKEYDLILTSHRLALVDSDHARDQPQVIPFATILSVKGGKTPAHEPLITLVLIDPVGVEDSTTLEMIFSQQPYEDRNGECELWVRKLIEHIVSDRHEIPQETTVQQPAKTQGRGPTVRRWVAPDKPGPHTTVSGKNKNKSEEILSALQNPSWTEEKPERPGSLNEDSAAEPDTQEKPAGSLKPSENNVLYEEPAAPAKEPVSSSPGNDDEEPAPASGEEPAGSLEQPGNNALPEETGEPVPEPETKHYDAPPEESVQDTAAETTGTEGEPVAEATVQNEIPPAPAEEEAAPLSEAAAAEPAPPVPPLDDKQRLMAEDEETLLGKEPEAEATVPPEPVTVPAAEPEVRSGLPDTVVFPVISEHGDSGEVPEQNEKEPETTPPAKPDVQQPPSRPPLGISPRGIAAIVIAAIVIACLAGAVFVLMSGESAHEETPTLPVTPAISVTPTATPEITVIPGTGVWVRVTYNGTFYGKYGNAGELREVRGTGDQFYPIKDSRGLVQASFEKLDNSGDTLIVGVYTNGTRVTQIEKGAPRATIALLVDPATGKAPYVPVTTAAS